MVIFVVSLYITAGQRPEFSDRIAFFNLCDYCRTKMFQFTRRQVRGLFGICIAAILLATLWPFDFRLNHDFSAARVSNIRWLPQVDPVRMTREDAVLNTFLFLPFGILFYLLLSGTGGVPSPIAVPVLLAALLSLAIETAQFWLPSRFSSVNDLAANVMGTLLGAITVRIWRGFVLRVGRDVIPQWFRKNAILITLTVYAIMLVASNIYTFNLVLKISDDSRKFFLH